MAKLKNYRINQYNLIRDYFAKRTFDESGNYSFDEFSIEVKESLNDRESNEGVYFEGTANFPR